MYLSELWLLSLETNFVLWQLEQTHVREVLEEYIKFRVRISISSPAPLSQQLKGHEMPSEAVADRCAPSHCRALLEVFLSRSYSSTPGEGEMLHGSIVQRRSPW